MPSRPARTLSVALSCNNNEAFNNTVQRDFIPVLGGVIDIKKDLVSFQKNFFRKSYYVRVSSQPAHCALLDKGKFMLGSTEWTITAASSALVNVTVHWAPDEMCDDMIAAALKPYGAVVDFVKPTFFDNELKHVRTGIRRYRFKCHSKRYVPNFINFAGDIVMFTYPGQVPECRKCGQARHKAHECKAKFCDNCNGFTPHENPHVEINCDKPCRHCHHTMHTISDCDVRNNSYAAKAREAEIRTFGEGPLPSSRANVAEKTAVKAGDLEVDADVSDVNVGDVGEDETADAVQPTGTGEGNTIDVDVDVNLGNVEIESGGSQPDVALSSPAGNALSEVGDDAQSSDRWSDVPMDVLAAVSSMQQEGDRKLENGKRAKIDCAAAMDSEDSDCEMGSEDGERLDMTPSPSQDIDTSMLEFRRKQSTAKRGRARKRQI